MTRLLLTCALMLSLSLVHAATVNVNVYDTHDTTKRLGHVTFQDSPHGLLVMPHLKGLNPGLHGLHLHEHPNCGDAGMKAGGHFDPDHTGHHKGPYGAGHKGDLPVMVVTAKGVADVVTLAPRLTTDDLKGLSLMIHEHGDNYTDEPPLGGGGGRIACGVVDKD